MMRKQSKTRYEILRVLMKEAGVQLVHLLRLLHPQNHLQQVLIPPKTIFNSSPRSKLPPHFFTTDPSPFYAYRPPINGVPAIVSSSPISRVIREGTNPNGAEHLLD
ncbi:unnamed protein product [Lactuca virosa]|uniref:Uncharacterized protein n=1 Tax=Lactuca virosa TaxID=75947 RepID=A0AAU9LJW1_9ASTR|nr:unnamed protein product [Lactuca virosa]